MRIEVEGDATPDFIDFAFKNTELLKRGQLLIDLIKWFVVNTLIIDGGGVVDFSPLIPVPPSLESNASWRSECLERCSAPLPLTIIIRKEYQPPSLIGHPNPPDHDYHDYLPIISIECSSIIYPSLAVSVLRGCPPLPSIRDYWVGSWISSH